MMGPDATQDQCGIKRMIELLPRSPREFVLITTVTSVMDPNVPDLPRWRHVVLFGAPRGFPLSASVDLGVILR